MVKPDVTFSRFYPATHPKAGEPTCFVESFWTSTGTFNKIDLPGDVLFDEQYRFLRNDFRAKHHTIRAGQRWRSGDIFSPRVWSGKPYCSKQIQFAPETEIIRTWRFEMIPALWMDECKFKLNGKKISVDTVNQIAMNDGLGLMSWFSWFCGKNVADSNRKGFEGQIICWNPNVKY